MFFFSTISFSFSFAKVFSFIFSIVFFENSQKCLTSQHIWCLIKTPLKNIIQTIFQGGSPWATLIHNSVVCLGVHYCVQLLPGVIFFQPVPFPFPLLKFVSLLLSFILLGIKNKGFPKDWFQPSKKKKHEWSGYTIVWFVWGYTIVSSCFLGLCFFFQPFPFPFPLLEYFLLFSQLFFFYISQKCSIYQNIWCLIKTQSKNITQTIFQGGSPRATLIHNSVVCLGVHYCVQLLPGVMFFFNHFLSLFLC